MLSRVADSLYWMSRYLERAEHTARLIDVNLNKVLEQTPEDATLGWERLITSLRIPPLAAEDVGDAYAITQALTFDTSHDSSIVSCINGARENARQVREQISSEMWEQINRLYLHMKRSSMEEIWYAEPHAFFAETLESIHLFQGITDATMTHGEGWHFIRVARFLERATATATLLDVHFTAFLEEQNSDSHAPLDYLSWVGLLKYCAAFEAYCKVYTANIQPNSIAEFLLLNADTPRSVRFAANMAQSALQAITRATHTRNAGRTERLAGRLRASLEYDQIDEIMSDDPHHYLENIQKQCAQIHNAIYQVYISYPIDVAITA